MKLEVAKRLHDAASACTELRELCAGHTRESFLQYRMLQLSVWKLIEVVGEALHQVERIDPTLTERVPDLRAIINTRHRIVHDYDGVSFRLLWDIFEHDIPSL